jgi:Flp pilus assembly protein TadD
MGGRSSRQWGVMAAVVALLTCAPTASAAPFTGAGNGVLAFSDAIQSPGPLGLMPRMPSLAQQLCAQKAAPARKLSLARALAHASRFAGHDAGAKAVRRFRRSKDARSERSALTAAAAAAADGRPTGALVALLRAHDLKPRDATPLIGAAAFLTQAGMPSEALALLARAQRLHPAKRGPFGVSPRAALANNRGYADLALHRWGAAEKVLRSARKQAPLLSEAGRNLAVALLCQNKQQPAAQMLFFALRRQQFKGDLVAGSAVPAGSQHYATPELFDLSHGVRPTLPSYHYPATVDEGAALRDGYFALQKQLSDDQAATIAEHHQAEANLYLYDKTTSPATRMRRQEIILAAIGAGGDPDIAPLDQKAGDLQSALGDIQLHSFDQAGPHCDGADALHANWLSTLQAYDKAERDLIVAVYQRQTGLAANLSDPVAHSAVLGFAREDVDIGLGLLASEAGFLATYDFGCFHDDQSAPPVAEGETDTPASPPCPTGLESKAFSINLKLVKIDVDCENVAVTAKIGAGWLGGFGRVSHNYGTGETTIFAGPQAGVKKSLLGYGAGAAVRDGLYLTTDASGAVKDFGFRVEHQESVKIPGLGKASSGDGMNFTFVGTSPIGSLVGF